MLAFVPQNIRYFPFVRARFEFFVSSFCCAFLVFRLFHYYIVDMCVLRTEKFTIRASTHLDFSHELRIASRSALSASFTIRWNHHLFNSFFLFLFLVLSYSLHTYYFSAAPLFVLFIFLIVPHSPLRTLRTRLFACKLSFLVVPSHIFPFSKKKNEIIIKCNGHSLTHTYFFFCNTTAMQCEPCNASAAWIIFWCFHGQCNTINNNQTDFNFVDCDLAILLAHFWEFRICEKVAAIEGLLLATAAAVVNIIDDYHCLFFVLNTWSSHRFTKLWYIGCAINEDVFVIHWTHCTRTMNGAGHGTVLVVVVWNKAHVTKETSKLRRVTITTTTTLIIRMERTKLSPTEICLNLIRLRDHTQTNSAFSINSLGLSRCVISKKQWKNNLFGFMVIY